MPWLCLLGHLQREKTSVCGSFILTDFGHFYEMRRGKEKDSELESKYSLCVFNGLGSDLRTIFTMKDCADIPETMSKYTPFFPYTVFIRVL